MTARPDPVRDIEGARALVVLGDSVTTDHISPAGAIPPRTPAGRYLTELGTARFDLNTYASRRGNHEVMMRGCFANVRLRNRLVPGLEGGFTRDFADGEVKSVFDAAVSYRAGRRLHGVRQRLVPRLGRQGPRAAGGTGGAGRVVRADPPFQPRQHGHPAPAVPRRQSAATLGLTGHETFSITGLTAGNGAPFPQTVTVHADDRAFEATLRLDTTREQDYIPHGGLMKYVVRTMLS
jgi:aconitate hydratase